MIPLLAMNPLPEMILWSRRIQTLHQNHESNLKEKSYLVRTTPVDGAQLIDLRKTFSSPIKI